LSEKEKQDGAVTETTEKASVKLTVQGSIQTGDTFETAMVKLKMKLSEKPVKASQETETVSQDTGASAEKPTGLAVEKAADSSETALFADPDEKQEGEPAETKKEAGMTVVKADSPAVTDTSSVDNSNPAAANVLNLNQPQKKDVTAILDKTETKATVQAKDIISQVVESAKVVTTPEKSEMVMELKPESLGKLSLKVVTEQGIVVAKFITESEQVKSILETNMQLLKDSLEKQGVNVQGFSVSVRQDNSYSAGKQYGNQNQQNGRRIVLNPVSLNRISAGMFIQDTSESLAKSNLYRFGSSTINLTA
jgi:flagellar hook-length control protein FliK